MTMSSFQYRIETIGNVQGVPKKLVLEWYQSVLGNSGTFDRNFDAKKSSDRLQIFFIYPTWVKENCKKFSDKNTVSNMVKIHFEKCEKFEKIQNFEIFIAKNNSVTARS